jgi:hypothetical protein
MFQSKLCTCLWCHYLDMPQEHYLAVTDIYIYIYISTDSSPEWSYSDFPLEIVDTILALEIWGSETLSRTHNGFEKCLCPNGNNGRWAMIFSDLPSCTLRMSFALTPQTGIWHFSMKVKGVGIWTADHKSTTKNQFFLRGWPTPRGRRLGLNPRQSFIAIIDAYLWSNGTPLSIWDRTLFYVLWFPSWFEMLEPSRMGIQRWSVVTEMTFATLAQLEMGDQQSSCDFSQKRDFWTFVFPAQLQFRCNWRNMAAFSLFTNAQQGAESICMRSVINDLTSKLSGNQIRYTQNKPSRRQVGERFILCIHSALRSSAWLSAYFLSGGTCCQDPYLSHQIADFSFTSLEDPIPSQIVAFSPCCRKVVIFDSF